MIERMQARARSTDPDTSHTAAFQVEATGKAKLQRQACLDEVTRKQGQTAAEIAAMCGLERHVPSRRLPELRDAKLVRNGEKRICAVMKRASMTWYLLAAEEQQELFGA
jgi:CRP-like cAMP-binding protein